MRIEELRIGNFVEYNGCTGIVYAVHSPMPCEDEHFRDIGIVELVIGGIVKARIDEIQPIQLTEELLLKLGFEKSDKLYSTWFNHYYWNITSGDISFNLIDNGTLECISYRHIKSMHQLQNLIYAIDGEELEIKK